MATPGGTTPSTGRTVAITATVTVLIVALLIGGWAMFFRGSGDDPSATATPSTTTTPSASPSSDIRTDGSADGCLGGPDAQTAVLQAQKDAAPTAKGAVEFAAAFVRWGVFYPRGDESADSRVIAATTQGQIRSKLTQKGALSQTPAGVKGRWWADTSDAHYKVVRFAGESAQIDLWVTQRAEVNGEAKKTVTGGRYELRRTGSGQWVGSSVTTPNGWKNVLDSGFPGTQSFAGGC